MGSLSIKRFKRDPVQTPPISSRILYYNSLNSEVNDLQSPKNNYWLYKTLNLCKVKANYMVKNYL